LFGIFALDVQESSDNTSVRALKDVSCLGESLDVLRFTPCANAATKYINTRSSGNSDVSLEILRDVPLEENDVRDVEDSGSRSRLTLAVDQALVEPVANDSALEKRLQMFI